MAEHLARPTTLDALLNRYPALLLDAYGVLVDDAGALPGAAALIERLHRHQHPYLVLSNSAARLPATMARDFARRGLPIPEQRIVSSGLLLQSWFAEHGLVGAPCLVLGPEDSVALCRNAGGEPVPVDGQADAEVIVLADQKGFDLLTGMNQALSIALRRLDAGQPLHLLLCNPDLIYPTGEGHFGFTAGGLAAMLDAVLRERYGAGHGFTRLGKPYRPLFDEAVRRLGHRDLLMVGDQLSTDIAGANAFGIDSALVLTGLARADTLSNAEAVPDWLLESLR